MAMKRGRPAQINVHLVESVLVKYKDQLYNVQSGKILSKTDPLWSDISTKLAELTGIQKSASALHTHVTCRKIFKNTTKSSTLSNVSILHLQNFQFA